MNVHGDVAALGDPGEPGALAGLDEKREQVGLEHGAEHEVGDGEVGNEKRSNVE